MNSGCHLVTAVAIAVAVTSNRRFSAVADKNIPTLRGWAENTLLTLKDPP